MDKVVREILTKEVAKLQTDIDHAEHYSERHQKTADKFKQSANGKKLHKIYIERLLEEKQGGA